MTEPKPRDPATLKRQQHCPHTVNLFIKGLATPCIAFGITGKAGTIGEQEANQHEPIAPVHAALTHPDPDDRLRH
jgi:hypothetical protein